MEQLNEIASSISLALGASWASGINLYAAILVLGFLGVTGNIVLPPDLNILMNPMVIAAAGIMYIVEFVADKIPGVDTGWDTIHTFIRIPAGVLLSAGAVGDINPAVTLTAGILGGGMAAGSHALKSGSRVMINTSPEPFTNWTASVVEDVTVIGGLWTALHYPWAFIIFAFVFVLLMIWLLPKIWRGVKKIFGFIGKIFGYGKEDKKKENIQVSGEKIESGQSENDVELRIKKLNDLFQKELITESEYQDKKQKILESI